MEKLKVIFLCLDDEYAGQMQKKVYEVFPDCVSCIVVSTTYYGRMGFLQTAWTILKKSGLRYFINMARLKLVKAKEVKSTISPLKLAKANGVSHIITDNINSDVTITQISNFEPDILVATNFNQMVGKTVRNLPALGTVNMHKAYLPKHRGMAPSFYALLDGDDFTGVSLHWMKRKIDRGNILCQSKIPVTQEDTVSSLNEKAAIAGGELLSDFLLSISKTGSIPEGTPQDEFLADEHSFPTRKEIRSFTRKGLRFF